MKEKEGFFKGVSNFDIYWRCWLPEGKPRAVIIVAHGIGEHIGRYMNLVNSVVPRGYAVYGLDHEGHGKSGGVREVVERFQVFIDDLKMLYDMAHKENPGLNIFLIGHSMGGLIATDYTVQHQQELAGLVASAPALKSSNITPELVEMLNKMSKEMPELGVLPIDTNLLSHDKQVVDAYNSDPLVFHGNITARLGAEMINTMSRLEPQIPSITLPLLVIQGSGDQIVDQAGAKLLYENAGSKDKTLKIYDGFYHESFNEPEHDKVFADLNKWLDAHV